MFDRMKCTFAFAAALFWGSMSSPAFAEQPGEVLPMPKPIPAADSCGNPGCMKTCVGGKALPNRNETELAENVQGRLVQKTYEVADLVVPFHSTCGCAGQNSDCCKTGTVPGQATAECKPCQPKTTEDTLIQTIVNTVAPQSWRCLGGSGTIDYFPLGYALVIGQTWDVQEQVAELLAALRRLQDVQVVIPTPVLCEIKNVAHREAASQDSCQRCAAVVANCGEANAPAALASSKYLTQVLEIYRQACATGQVDLAKKLATLAIEMDPTCFSK